MRLFWHVNICESKIVPYFATCVCCVYVCMCSFVFIAFDDDDENDEYGNGDAFDV